LAGKLLRSPPKSPPSLGRMRAGLVGIFRLVRQSVLMFLTVVRATNISGLGELLAKKSVSYYDANNP
jgi:putative exporter of polyketide antibiotics